MTRKPIYFEYKIVLLLTILICLSCTNNLPKKSIEKKSVSCYEFEKDSLINGLIYLKKDKLKIKIYSKESSDEIRNKVLYSKPSIYINDKLVTKLDKGYNYEFSKQNFVLIISNEIFYVLLRKYDAIEGENWEVIRFQNNKLDIYDVPFSDLENLDSDNWLEIGSERMIEAYCLSCDSAYYNPPLIYELSENFKLDTILIKEKTLEKYNVFLGYKYLDIPVKLK